MPKTAIALYDKMSDAQDTVRDLSNNKFDRDEIHMTMPGPDAGRSAMDNLSDLELSADDAEIYAEGVERGGTLVVVDTTDELAPKAADIMSKHSPVDIDGREDQWRQEGWNHFEVEGKPYAGMRSTPQPQTAPTKETVTERTSADKDVAEGIIVPEEPAATKKDTAKGKSIEVGHEEEQRFEEIEEEVITGTRVTPRGKVLIHTRIVEEPFEKEVSVHEQKVDVERQAVSRPATEEERRMLEEEKGEKIYEFTETGEELVVTKEARVVGQVDVEREIEEHPQKVRGTVRRREIDVERAGADEKPVAGKAIDEGAITFENYDNSFQRHFQKTYAGQDAIYDNYRPAYRYGFDLANSARYQDKDWKDIESEVHKRWEDRNPGTWEDYKGAIYEGWYESHGEKERVR